MRYRVSRASGRNPLLREKGNASRTAAVGAPPPPYGRLGPTQPTNKTVRCVPIWPVFGIAFVAWVGLGPTQPTKKTVGGANLARFWRVFVAWLGLALDGARRL